MTAVVIGLDLGTSSVKCVALDAEGRRHARAAVDVELDAKDERAEQDPEEILAAATAAVRRCAHEVGERSVVGVSLGGAMHALLGLDAEDRPLTPSVTWADGRARSQVAALRGSVAAAGLLTRTGTPLHPMSPLAKLLWYADEQPQLAARVTRWASPKELLVTRWCGARVVDHATAGCTGLLDVRHLEWDAEALELAGVTPERLSELASPTRILELRPHAAVDLGLPPGTPVVLGATDGVLENLGAGADGGGVAVVTIGTSSALRITLDRPATDPRGRFFCYPQRPGRWVVGGPTSSGGLTVMWAAEALFPEIAARAVAEDRDPGELVDELAATVPPGADGVRMHPALVGDRAPSWDASATATITGLTARTGRAHVLRAVLEGVAAQLRGVLDALEDAGHPVHEIRATGGFTSSRLWVEIVGDALGHELVLPEAGDTAAVGAVLLAREAGIGLASTVSTGPVNEQRAGTRRHRP